MTYIDLPKDHGAYHDFSHLTIAQRGYWAGLLDGEGCLRLDCCSGAWLPSISLAMTCEKTLNAFRDTFQLGTVLIRTRNGMKDHWKDCYVIKTTTHKAAKICEILLPYFITKDVIAKEISKFYIHQCEMCGSDFWCFNNHHTCSKECQHARKIKTQAYSRERLREEKKKSLA